MKLKTINHIIRKSRKGLTNAQISVLEAVAYKIPIEIIASNRNCSRQSIYKILNRLFAKKLIIRIGFNKRKVILTEDGKKELINLGKLEVVEKLDFENRPKCEVCGYNLYVHNHHIDCNRENNSYSNRINLCPNHHLLIHSNKATLRKIDGKLYYLIEIQNSWRFFVND